MYMGKRSGIDKAPADPAARGTPWSREVRKRTKY